MTETTTAIGSLLDLTGHRAIVTGGAMGIGRAVAARLAEAGALVVVADLDGEAAEVTAKDLSEHGHTVRAVQADVSVEADAQRLIDTTVGWFGGVDLLVNNAGIFPTVPVLDMPADAFARVIGVNLQGVFLCSRAAARQMVDQGTGGRIVNVTSVDALHPSSVGLAHYDASKHGVWGFTKNLALELAPHRIWVNAIAPGGIVTPGVAHMSSGAATDPQILERFMARIPMGRMGEPDEIGKAVLFLASDMASYVTGSQLVVDGGVLLA